MIIVLTKSQVFNFNPYKTLMVIVVLYKIAVCEKYSLL